MAERNNSAAQPDAPDANPAMIVSRVFDAPRELVFAAWTDPAFVKRWWGAGGFTVPSCAIDLKPGGRFDYHMRSAEGRDYRCACVYREVRAPERLVFTNGFVDTDGNPVPHPDLATWPRETLITVTFAEHAGKTTVTLTQIVAEGTAEERKTFEFARGGAAQFWTQSLERLAPALSERQSA